MKIGGKSKYLVVILISIELLIKTVNGIELRFENRQIMYIYTPANP